jgi:hypothetical protein
MPLNINELSELEIIQLAEKKLSETRANQMQTANQLANVNQFHTSNGTSFYMENQDFFTKNILNVNFIIF